VQETFRTLCDVDRHRTKADQHDLAVWSLADGGWRQVLMDRLDGLREARNRRLNTPKAGQIDDLFFRALGIEMDAW